MSNKSKYRPHQIVPAGNPTPAPSSAQIVRKETLYQGPIPNPHDLKLYDELSPGLALRLVTFAETNAAHDREMQKSQLDHAHEQDKRQLEVFAGDLRMGRKETTIGQWLGFTIGSLAIFCGSVLVFLSHDVAGSVIGGSGVAGIVSVFVIGRNLPKKEGPESTPEEQKPSNT